MRVYGIKNCNNVKKALKILDANNVKYEFIDYKKNVPSSKQICTWLDLVGMDVLLNTKGTTYKKLQLGTQNLNESQKIAKMQEFPSLIKRPIIETEDALIVGFDEEKIQALR